MDVKTNMTIRRLTHFNGDEKRYGRVIGTLDKEYAYLIHNRFTMYSGRDSQITERNVRCAGKTHTEYSVWVELLPTEASARRMEVALRILENMNHSGENWEKYYSPERQRNEIHY